MITKYLNANGTNCVLQEWMKDLLGAHKDIKSKKKSSQIGQVKRDFKQNYTSLGLKEPIPK